MVRISDDVVTFIVDHYTCEPGVRKLKQILFEVVSEVNLSVLKQDISFEMLPIEITSDDVKEKVFEKEETSSS